jgi:biopolymer transport protein ExbD
MKNWALFVCIGMLSSIMGCGQTDRNTAIDADSNRLTCIFPGYDSIIYYHGASSRIQGVKRGVVTDSMFMDSLIRTIKDRGGLVMLKMGAGGGMFDNYQQMVDLLNSNQVVNRGMDTLDINEQQFFGFVTAPQAMAMLKGEQPEIKLNVPREEHDTSNILAGFPKASRLTVLISGDDGIYAYMGEDLKNGKKYTYQEITGLLKEKKKNKDFSVEIKPTESSTYKSTVNMLDVMVTADMKHYALVDITKEEEDYLRQINR